MALPAPVRRPLPASARAGGRRRGRCLRRRLRPHVECSRFACAPQRTSGMRPFAELALQRAPGQVSEITAREARELFPPLGPVHRALFAPALGPGRRPWPGRRAAPCGLDAWRHLRRGRGHGPARSDGTGPAGHGRRGSRGHPTCPATPWPWRVAPGRHQWRHGWRSRCPWDPPRGRSCTSASTATRPAGPSPNHCSRTTWCRGPADGWPAVGPSSPVQGSRSTSPPPACTSSCASASPVAPGLEGSRYLETRVGLRPTSADDRALVGPVPGWSNAWMATGHGANGLLQGPYSARLLADAVAGVPPLPDEPPLPALFDPARFT